MALRLLSFEAFKQRSTTLLFYEVEESYAIGLDVNIQQKHHVLIWTWMLAILCDFVSSPDCNIVV